MSADISRTRRYRPLFMGLVWAVTAAVEAGQIFFAGETWRYYKGTNTPAAQGSLDWTDIDFVHTNWPQGASGFGYGDGDDATVLNDMEGLYASVFTRRRFVINDPGEVTHLSIGCDYDDGFVAYLNGQEAVRHNMPTGIITHATLAASYHECSRSTDDTSGDWVYYDIDPGLLVAGSNVLAVSGHNVLLNVSSDFSLSVVLFTNVTLLRGPFVQMPRGDDFSIAWRTDALTDSVLHYGLDTNYTAGVVSNATLVRDHRLTLTNLVPGTTFYYRIRSGGETLADAVPLHTPRAAGQPFRAALFGDFGTQTSGSTAIAARVNSAGIHVMQSLGDNIYDNGQSGDYDRYWFSRYAPTMRSAPDFVAPGNHDNNLGNWIWILTNFYLPTNGPTSRLERVYSYDYANVHVAVIDSNPFNLNDTAAINLTKAWLSNDLATATNTWKFVAYHHPPYTTTGGHPEDAVMKAQVSPILEKYGVHFAFQGHNHWYERVNPVNGVNYITAGGGGRSLNGYSTRAIYSGFILNSVHSFAQVDVNGPELTVQCIDQSGTQRDVYRLDLSHPFMMDGRLDNSAWGRATNNLVLYAAIRGKHLYLAMQDAGEGNDHFIFLNDHQDTNRASAWAKAGNNMQWAAFMADENDQGYFGWYGPQEQILSNYPTCRMVTSGLNNNSTNGNGVMEGTIDLAAYFGSFPPELYVAGAPYGTASGGALIAGSTVPTNNGSANINSNEYLLLLTRDLALDLPSADAGPDQAIEAGMGVTLTGSALVPSGLPASYAWAQTIGEGVALNSATSLTTGFTFTNWIDNSTNLEFQFTVHDTRFDSNDTVVVTVLPLADTDGDGLSDQEELSGVNNVITFFNPGGHITLPDDADTDDDGLSDAHESLAGTSPTNALSVLSMAASAIVGEEMLIQWPSVTDHYYMVYESTNLNEPALPIVSNIPATPPMNTHTTAVPLIAPVFHFIEVQQSGP